MEDGVPLDEATTALRALVASVRDVQVAPTDDRMGRDDPEDVGAFRVTAESDHGPVSAVARTLTSPVAIPVGDRVTRVAHGWACLDAGLSWVPAGPSSFSVALVPAGDPYGVSIRSMAREGLSTTQDAARIGAVGQALWALHASTTGDRPHAARRPFEGELGVVAALVRLEHGGACAIARSSAIERGFAVWRARLSAQAPRRVRVHGGAVPDMFVLGETGAHAIASVRRGVGEPAEDVATLAVALLAEGIADGATWPHGYLPLWRALWSSYLTASGDYALLDVAPPFLAWRALVVASGLAAGPPPARVAARLIDLAERWLAARTFDPDHVAVWLGTLRTSGALVFSPRCESPAPRSPRSSSLSAVEAAAPIRPRPRRPGRTSTRRSPSSPLLACAPRSTRSLPAFRSTV